MEYLVTMTTHVPAGTPDAVVDEIRGREAVRARELVGEGRLLRLWRPPLRPGEWRTLGLFAAADRAELEQVLASMPLRVCAPARSTPLSAHPNDPGIQGRHVAVFSEPRTGPDGLRAGEAAPARPTTEPSRSPRREENVMDVPALAALLRETEEHHGVYEAAAPAHHWSDWYAAYILARQSGRSPEEASGDAARYMETAQ